MIVVVVAFTVKVVRSFSHITEDEAYVVRLQKLCIEKKVKAVYFKK